MRTHRLLSAVLLALPAALAVLEACSSTDDATPAPVTPAPTVAPTATTPPSDRDAAPPKVDDASAPATAPITAAAAHDICVANKAATDAWFASHCSASDKTRPEYAKLALGSTAKCEARLLARAAKGALAYDPAKIAACTAAYADALKTATSFDALLQTISQATYGPMRDLCDAVMVGLVPAGGSCSEAGDCTKGLTCVGYSGGGMFDGTCQTPPAIGQACRGKIAQGGEEKGTAAHPTCAGGAMCDTVTKACAAPRTAGGDCNTTDMCATGLRCLASKCAAGSIGSVGAACNGGLLDCKAGLDCVSGSCAAKLPAGPATCNPALNGFGPCAGVCVQPEGGASSCEAFCGSK